MNNWNYLVFVLFGINIIGTIVNHIDDTDETYGYWEPLHYILEGRGMQTWEYSPEFAIRTYSFLSPFIVFGHSLGFMFQGISIFYLIRLILAFFTANVQTLFIANLHKYFGDHIAKLYACFMIFSPGVFHANTSLQPSALVSSFLMLSIIFWLQNKYAVSIAFGSIGVIWSGWPFVGLLLLPIGLHMLVTVYNQRKSLSDVIVMMIVGGVTVFIVTIPSILIDVYYYGKITFPALNIIIYNVFSASMGAGDHLYGVEPVSYYIKNLFLTTGLAWPISILTLPVLFLEYYFKIKDKSLTVNVITLRMVMIRCTYLWLAVLFSRIHKEERFMYPVYPFLCLLAAFTTDSMIQLFTNGISKVLSVPTTRYLPAMRMIGLVKLVLICGVLGVSRVISNYNSFHGYLQLWKDINTIQFLPRPDESSLKLCMGDEWYTFPSHYFLPNNITLHYYYEHFDGMLPHYFEKNKGTSYYAIGRFNNLNKANFSHFTPLYTCDLVVTSKTLDELTQLRDHSIQSDTTVKNNSENTAIPPTQLLASSVIDPDRSKNTLARAYFIPTYSTKYNTYKSYVLYSFVPVTEKNDSNEEEESSNSDNNSDSFSDIKRKRKKNSDNATPTTATTDPNEPTIIYELDQDEF